MDIKTIEKWEQNRIPCYLLTDAEFVELCSFDFKELQWREFGGNWTPNPTKPTKDSSLVYRLRPDYEPKPEPKIVKRELSISNAFGSNIGLEKNAENAEFVYLHMLMDDLNFSHFEDRVGNKISVEDIATKIRNGGQVYVVEVVEEV